MVDDCEIVDMKNTLYSLTRIEYTYDDVKFIMENGLLDM